MTQEEKLLLLKDLCSRLPYGVKVITSVGGEIRNDKEQLNFAQLSLFEAGHEEVKPYLFPLSSMIEEQKYNNPIGLSQMLTILANRDWECITIKHRDLQKLIDWYNKNHFDYRGLIPMGLAKDATGLNIY